LPKLGTRSGTPPKQEASNALSPTPAYLRISPLCAPPPRLGALQRGRRLALEIRPRSYAQNLATQVFSAWSSFTASAGSAARAACRGGVTGPAAGRKALQGGSRRGPGTAAKRDPSRSTGLVSEDPYFMDQQLDKLRQSKALFRDAKAMVSDDELFDNATLYTTYAQNVRKRRDQMTGTASPAGEVVRPVHTLSGVEKQGRPKEKDQGSVSQLRNLNEKMQTCVKVAQKLKALKERRPSLMSLEPESSPVEELTGVLGNLFRSGTDERTRRFKSFVAKHPVHNQDEHSVSAV